MNANLKKRIDMVNQFADQAKEYHRRHDVVLRRQAEESIREVAPSLAYAEEVIRELYK